MIKNIYSVVCRESKIEADTNNISIIDAYENLQFDLNVEDSSYDPTKPVLAPFNFEVVSLFYRDKKGSNESLTTTITILDPKGNKLGEFSSDIEFKEEHDRMRNRVKFNTIAVDGSGTYVFQIHTQKQNSDKRELVAAIPLGIEVLVNGKKR